VRAIVSGPMTMPDDFRIPVLSPRSVVLTTVRRKSDPAA
jgi:hypothetical protein